MRNVAALYNAKHGLALLIPKGDLAALRPADRHFHGSFDFFGLCRQGDAFIKLHLDIRSQQALNFDGAFRRHVMQAAIQMRFESHALLIEFSQAGERHDLKSAAVGQHRFVPAYQFVQAAQTRHTFRARPQHQVICVPKNDISAEIPHLIEIHRLDCADCPNRHECRCLNIAARHRNFTTSRATIFCRNRKLEFLRHYMFLNSRLASP